MSLWFPVPLAWAVGAGRGLGRAASDRLRAGFRLCKPDTSQLLVHGRRRRWIARRISGGRPGAGTWFLFAGSRTNGCGIAVSVDPFHPPPPQQLLQGDVLLELPGDRACSRMVHYIVSI